MFQYWSLDWALHPPVVTHQAALKRERRIDSTMNGLRSAQKKELKMLLRLSFQPSSVVCA